MDEILIDEKRYVSSKQAAKITGYAKDYIGQLCREGRVPARLVGRSWYVLESAIKDHRFGGTSTPEVLEKPKKSLPNTWESPKYESDPVYEAVPHINRITSSTAEYAEMRHEEPSVAPAEDTGVEDTWRAWFDRIVETTERATGIKEESVPAPVSVNEEEVGQVHATIQSPEEIPVRRVTYERPPVELLPRTEEERVVEIRQADNAESPRAKRSYTGVIVAPIAIATIALATLAILNSGIADKYLGTVTQAHQITGVLIVNKPSK